MRKHCTRQKSMSVCVRAMCIEWKVLFVVHSSFVFHFCILAKRSESLRHHFVNWMMTLLQPTQFTQQSNEASEKERTNDKNELIESHTVLNDMGLHCTAHTHRKGIGNTMECIVIIMHKIYTLFYVWICSINSFRIVDLVLFCVHHLSTSSLLFLSSLGVDLMCNVSNNQVKSEQKQRHNAFSSFINHTPPYKRMRKNTFSRIS